MRKVSMFIVLAQCLFILSGCGLKKPDQLEVQNAYYGEEPKNYEQIIKGYMEPRLFDPFSAVYKFDIPRKGWVNRMGIFYYGWKVDVDINAKNRMGGYVGFKRQRFVLRDGAIIIEGPWKFYSFYTGEAS